MHIIKLQKGITFKEQFVCLDIQDCVIPKIAEEKGLTMGYRVYSYKEPRPDFKYNILLIDIKKKYIDSLMEVLKEAEKRILLRGYSTYNKDSDTCFKEIFGVIDEGYLTL